MSSGCSQVQVEFVAGSGQTVLSDGSLQLTFTSANWATEQTVTLRAKADTIIDGNDVQAFPDRSRRLTGIQGPLFVSGGDDPDPPVQLSLDGYLPILLPGETSGETAADHRVHRRMPSSPPRSTASSSTTRTALPPTSAA